MKVAIQVMWNNPVPAIDDEPPERAALLSSMLADADGQEDLYLGEIAKAEAGATIKDLYNNIVDVQLYPDGHVIIEELRYNEQDEILRGPPARIEITMAEAKQLLLDWLAAKQQWYAQRDQEAAKPGNSNGGAPS